MSHHAQFVELLPVLDYLTCFQAADLNAGYVDGFTCWGNLTKGAVVSASPGNFRDDVFSLCDLVLDGEPEVRKRSQIALCQFPQPSLAIDNHLTRAMPDVGLRKKLVDRL